MSLECTFIKKMFTCGFVGMIKTVMVESNIQTSVMPLLLEMVWLVKI